MADATFGDEYRRRARAVSVRAASALLAAQETAVRTLLACMGDESSPATRVRAARAVLEIAHRISADDLDLRLTELEGRMTEWHATAPRLASTG